MKKQILVFAVILASVLSLVFVLAQPPEKVSADVINSNGHAKVTIPANAVEVSPGVFSLGSAVINGENVEGYAFVHYKDNLALTGKANNALAGSSCYGFLSKGAKWKSIENWIVNPSNIRGLDGNFVFSNLGSDISKWESASGKNILGTGALTSDVLTADTITPDNKNEVYFADVSNSGAIAITIVWGRFSGPTYQRYLVEWDQVYDDVDYPWSASGEAGKMDFESIATHELGHSVGMNDLYTLSCSEQTMCGYASYGETKKRTLEIGDVTGVRKLYA